MPSLSWVSRLPRLGLQVKALARLPTYRVYKAHFPFASVSTSAVPFKNISFPLADIGEAIAEVELVSWSVEVGQKVKEFDEICIVESDKATTPITSRYEGTITKLYYDEGEQAQTGLPLLDIEVDDGEADAGGDAPSEAAVEAPAAEAVAATSAESAPAPTGTGGKLKYPMTPAVRRIIKENNVDLSLITPTGKNGRVLKEDVLRYMEGGQAPPVATPSTPTPTPAAPAPSAAQQQPEAVVPVQSAPSAATGDVTVPLTRVQKTMVKSMNAALQIPHFGYSDEVELNELIQVRKHLKGVAESRGVKLSYMPFILKAASMALLRYPMLNSHVDAEATAMTYKASHNLSLAMQTPQGLLVPNVKDVQTKTIFEIAEDLNRLQTAGMAGRLGASDLTGGTFAISNIGVVGGTYMTPILVVPQVAIGALGALKKRPRYNAADELYQAHIMEVSWSADHRVIDGVTMAEFSNLWKSYLQDPSTMLLDMK